LDHLDEDLLADDQGAPLKIMNNVPAAGLVPCRAISGVAATAVTPVTVAATNDGSAGGVGVVAVPLSRLTVLTLMNDWCPVRLMVWPSEFTTVKESANAFQLRICAAVSPRHAAL
jgi:hypothetical protein